MSAPARQLYVVGGDLPVSAPDPLAVAVADDVDARLDAVLDRVGERLAREAEATAPLDPELVDRLDEVCTRAGAVVELASLHRHVEEGALTWDAVWAAPEDHAGGVRLVCEVMALAAAEPDPVLGAPAVLD